MKLIGKLLFIILVVLVGLVLARNIVIKAAAEAVVPAVTGLPLSIQKFDLDILNTSIDIEGIQLKNPAGFHDTELVNIPKILVAYQCASILTGKLHFKELEFDMKQFTVVKNEKGALNLDSLRALQGTQKPSAPKQAEPPKAPAKPIPIQIDLMRLKIGKVVFMDYSGAQPSIKEFPINIDQNYQNITDLNSVVRLIVLKAMMSSGISNLVNFDVQGLAGSLTSSSKELANQLTGQLGALKGTTDTATKEAKALTGTVTGAASDLKNKMKSLF